jgi:hypothetical protein
LIHVMSPRQPGLNIHSNKPPTEHKTASKHKII